MTDESRESKNLTVIGEIIFAIRWGLVPMYLLMFVPIFSYCLWFAQEVFSFWIALYDDPPHEFAVGPWHPHLLHHNGEDFILWTLGLIDASMVANLLVMIAVGGFSTFVKEFDFATLRNKPRWMNRLDSMTLKIKMAVSMIAITAILILRTSMEYNKEIADMLREHTYNYDRLGLMGFNLAQQVIVHVIFIATAFGFSWVAKMLHGHTPAPSSSERH